MMYRLGFYMALLWAVGACGSGYTTLQGYIEARLTYLSSPRDGKLTELKVRRGQLVPQGTHLFTLEAMPESAARDSARFNLGQAQAALNDLLKGKRTSELDEIRARIEGAQASITYYNKELARRQKLASAQNIPVEQVDRTLLDLSTATTALKQAQALLATAELPARDDQIAEAREQVKSAEAALSQANWALTAKTVYAPGEGLVFDTLYQVGEHVSPDHPVISFLVPNDVYAVFFVPEPQLATVQLGARVDIHCDGCEKLEGEISFISPQAEFTPPVIYSQSARSKLVYRVEAKFEKTNLKKLHPGQPIDVILRKQ